MDAPATRLARATAGSNGRERQPQRGLVGKDEDATAVVLEDLLVSEPFDDARVVERLHRLARPGIAFEVIGFVVSHVVHLPWIAAVYERFLHCSRKD